MSNQGLIFDLENYEFRIDDGTEYFVLWKVIFNDFAIVALKTKESPTQSFPIRTREEDKFHNLVRETHHNDLMRRFEELKKQKLLEHKSD